MALNTDAFNELMAQINSMLDSDTENNLTNEQIIELQNTLETYMTNNEIATQTENDWKNFCFNLLSYLQKGYEITIMQGNLIIGYLTAKMFDEGEILESDEKIEVLPESFQQINVIRLPSPAGQKDDLIEDPDEYYYEDLALDPDENDIW